MKYLILGKNGQLGTEWCRQLKTAGASFEAADSDVIDITVPRQVNDALTRIRPNVVINCAAYTNVDGAESELDLNDKVNHLGPSVLANSCMEHGIRLVHYSTDYVFSGSEADRHTYPEGYPEDAPTAPLNAYGKSKLNGELAVRASGAEHLILRISWLCGPDGKNFLKTMLSLGSERPELNVVNDQFGSPCFTFDVVDATCVLLESGQTGTFHLGSQGMCTWFDFASRIFTQAGLDVKVNPVSSDAFPVTAARPHFSKMSTAKFEKATGGCKYQMDEGISRTLSLLKNDY